MPLSLSTAKTMSSRKASSKVISEYKGKASPGRTGSFNGSSNRRRTKKGKS